MKKLISAVSIAAVMFTLAGCSTDAAAPVGPVTVTATSIATSVVTTVAFMRTTEATTETEFITETAVETETVEKKVPTTVVKTAVKTVSVTAAAGPAAPAPAPSASSSSLSDGTYIIGTDIAEGTYKCTDEGEYGATWLISDASGELVEGNASAVAYVNQGNSVDLNGCDGSWQKVG